MDNILSQLNNPIVWAFVGFVGGLFLKSKDKAYYKLLGEIIDVVEVFNDDIKEVLSKDTMKNLRSIKKRIDDKLSVSDADKMLLDKMLDEKGLLKKSSLGNQLK